MVKSIVDTVSEQRFREAIQKYKTFEEVARSIGLKFARGLGVTRIKNRAARLNIDISHFDGRRKHDLDCKVKVSAKSLRLQLKRVNRKYICEHCQCKHMDKVDGEWFWMVCFWYVFGMLLVCFWYVSGMFICLIGYP